MRHVLILGGTAEARALAAVLPDEGFEVTSSLAGRVKRPKMPVGSVRVGGFGGIDGMRAALVDYDAVVDATHPFAATISANAVAACASRQMPLLRLERPGWEERGHSSWRWVDTHAEAAEAAAECGKRPFLTVGRQRLGEFTEPLKDLAVLARVVDEPALDLPPAWQLIRDRGPYTQAAEYSVLHENHVDVLVTKNSGGEYTWPKMQAAYELDVPIVIVRRPPVPDGVPMVTDVDEAVAWLHAES